MSRVRNKRMPKNQNNLAMDGLIDAALEAAKRARPIFLRLRQAVLEDDLEATRKHAREYCGVEAWQIEEARKKREREARKKPEKGAICVICTEEVEYVTAFDQRFWLDVDKECPRICLPVELIEFLKSERVRNLRQHPFFTAFE